MCCLFCYLNLKSFDFVVLSKTGHRQKKITNLVPYCTTAWGVLDLYENLSSRYLFTATKSCSQTARLLYINITKIYREQCVKFPCKTGTRNTGALGNSNTVFWGHWWIIFPDLLGSPSFQTYSGSYSSWENAGACHYPGFCSRRPTFLQLSDFWNQ